MRDLALSKPKKRTVVWLWWNPSVASFPFSWPLWVSDIVSLASSPLRNLCVSLLVYKYTLGGYQSTGYGCWGIMFLCHLWCHRRSCDSSRVATKMSRVADSKKFWGFIFLCQLWPHCRSYNSFRIAAKMAEGIWLQKYWSHPSLMTNIPKSYPTNQPIPFLLTNPFSPILLSTPPTTVATRLPTLRLHSSIKAPSFGTQT